MAKTAPCLTAAKRYSLGEGKFFVDTSGRIQSLVAYLSVTIQKVAIFMPPSLPPLREQRIPGRNLPRGAYRPTVYGQDIMTKCPDDVTDCTIREFWCDCRGCHGHLSCPSPQAHATGLARGQCVGNYNSSISVAQGICGCLRGTGRSGSRMASGGEHGMEYTTRHIVRHGSRLAAYYARGSITVMSLHQGFGGKALVERHCQEGKGKEPAYLLNCIDMPDAARRTSTPAEVPVRLMMTPFWFDMVAAPTPPPTVMPAAALL
jgi:hypothetical protein